MRSYLLDTQASAFGSAVLTPLLAQSGRWGSCHVHIDVGVEDVGVGRDVDIGEMWISTMREYVSVKGLLLLLLLSEFLLIILLSMHMNILSMSSRQ